LQIERYMSKISGPLLDRIDLHLEVPAVPFRELSAQQSGTDSARMRDDVERARTVQAARFGGRSPLLNGRMTPRQIRKYCKLNSAGEQMLKAAMTELGLSARAHDRILRVSRTIADLEGTADIQAHHVSEAINYRTLDRNYWA
jgi:magnesium chelatase family protein